MEVVLQDKSAGRKYVGILVKIMKNVTSDTKAQHYAVSRVDEVVSEDPAKHGHLFCDEVEGNLDQTAFMRVIQSGDAAAQQVASVLLALLVVTLKANAEVLLQWICDQLSGGRAQSLGVRGAVQSLCVLLRTEEARLSFAHRGGVGYLNTLLRMQARTASMCNSQLLYELCFCLWSMSLCDEARQDFMLCGAVPTLSQQARRQPIKAKIIRVALSALRQLTEGQVDGFNAEMISCGLPKTLDQVKTRTWADPDIAEDAEYLSKCLQRNYRELSTIERYSQEVMSGQLRWGVVHTEKFWRENNRAVETDEFFILKQLIDLLKSEDETVVSIACYDLGEFVRFYPSGKAIVRHLGAKEKVMDLIESKDVEVQRQALQCISKIMVNKWEFVR
ncbi:unnamed protein product [Discosporangium mesarthrocarpum]